MLRIFYGWTNCLFCFSWLNPTQHPHKLFDAFKWKRFSEHFFAESIPPVFRLLSGHFRSDDSQTVSPRSIGYPWTTPHSVSITFSDHIFSGWRCFWEATILRNDILHPTVTVYLNAILLLSISLDPFVKDQPSGSDIVASRIEESKRFPFNFIGA